MRIVVVNFRGSSREYEYKTELQLIAGGRYSIVADGITTYNTDIEVVGYRKEAKYAGPLREITAAKCISAPPVPDDNIEKVFFNEDKRVTVIVWKDGVKTSVRCDPRDTFSKETGIAMCYMKRYFKNRGAYNRVFKKWCHEEGDI